jgi:carbamoyltransferase
LTARHVLLAVHEDSNANAALFVDGRLVAAVAEERISRKRYQAGFPHRSVDEVLRLAGLTRADVTEFVAGNRFHVVPRLPGKPPPSWDRSFMGALHWGYLGYQDAMRRLPFVGEGVEAFSRASLKRSTGWPTTLVDHHESHAASAAFSSGWERALVVTIDNFGDGTSCTAWSFAHGALAELRRVPAGDSPGQFYGEIAELLGVHPLLAGKVTGLAAGTTAGDSVRFEQVQPIDATLSTIAAYSP